MTNYILLIVGSILVGIGYYGILSVEYGSLCNILGIVSMIHAITWDY